MNWSGQASFEQASVFVDQAKLHAHVDALTRHVDSLTKQVDKLTMRMDDLSTKMMESQQIVMNLMNKMLQKEMAQSQFAPPPPVAAEVAPTEAVASQSEKKIASIEHDRHTRGIPAPGRSAAV